GLQRDGGAQSRHFLKADVDGIRNQPACEEEHSETKAEREIAERHDQTCPTEMELTCNSMVSKATSLLVASKLEPPGLPGMASLMCQPPTGAPASSHRLIVTARDEGGSAVSQSAKNVLLGMVPFFSVTVEWPILGKRVTFSPCQ